MELWEIEIGHVCSRSRNYTSCFKGKQFRWIVSVAIVEIWMWMDIPKCTVSAENFVQDMHVVESSKRCFFDEKCICA